MRLFLRMSVSSGLPGVHSVILMTFGKCLTNHIKAFRDLSINEFEKPPDESIKLTISAGT